MKKKVLLIASSFIGLIILIFILISSKFSNKFSIGLVQCDELYYSPEYTQKYLDKLNEEGEVLSISFSNIGKKTEYYVNYVSHTKSELLDIEKIVFCFDNMKIEKKIQQQFCFHMVPFDDVIPGTFFDAIQYNQTKINLKFRKIFRNHLKENENFFVDVEIFYKIDGKEKNIIRKYRAYSYEMLEIFMLG